jgi:hypothetical protein
VVNAYGDFLFRQIHTGEERRGEYRFTPEKEGFFMSLVPVNQSVQVFTRFNQAPVPLFTICQVLFDPFAI